MRWFRKEQSMRRIFLGGAFAATLAIGVMMGTLLSSDRVEAQVQQTTFSSDAAVMLHFIKPGSTAAYEGVMARLREALQNSGNTETDRQAQARGWKVYRAATSITGPGSVMYAWVIDPVVGGANYAVATILNEVFPTEIQQLFESYNGAFTDAPTKIVPIDLTLVADF
jgi:cytochrome bd-type quinol oxidase subunit 2